MKELRPYQTKLILAYMNGEFKYIAVDAGLGKTRMAIEIAKRMKAKRVLVLCPASVKLSWVGELKQWAPTAKFHTPVTPRDVGAFDPYGNAPLWTIVNYDKCSRENGFVERLVAAGPYDLAILDEAHFCKELTAKRTRAVYRVLAPVCGKILPMSATPMTRSASDLYVPLRFMAPEAITDKNGRIMTLHQFQDRYCNVEMRRIGTRLVRQVSGSRNMAELKERMGGFFYRLLKKDCLPELPPMQWEQLPIGLAREDYAPIAELIGDVDLDRDDLLDVVTREAHIMRAMQMIGLAKVGTASQYIRDFLADNDLKITVWARHHAVIDAICEKLSDFNPAVIDGRVDQKGRAAAVNAFLTDPECRIFVGQCTAAGTGLTLLNETVQPRDVFFIESDWSPSVNYQSASRVHRLGADGSGGGVLVRVMTAQGVGLDMRLQALLTRKASEFETLIDGE